MRIRNSLIALFIYRYYNAQNSAMGKATGRISSGNRINSAADDAAGLAISEKVRARIRSLNAAMHCSEDGASLTQTAEGAMASIHSALQRMHELAVQSASDTNDETDRGALDEEYQQLLRELDDIAREARFNGRILLSDGLGGEPDSLIIQTGPDTGDSFILTLDTLTPDKLGISGTLVRSSTDAAAAISGLNSAIDHVSADRANMGAVQARLDSRISSMEIAVEELTATDSRIRDTDVAEEMVRLTQARLLAHISTAMMAQANALAGNVLYLLAAQMMSAQSAASASDAGSSSTMSSSAGASSAGTSSGGTQQTQTGGTSGVFVDAGGIPGKHTEA